VVQQGIAAWPGSLGIIFGDIADDFARVVQRSLREEEAEIHLGSDSRTFSTGTVRPALASRRPSSMAARVAWSSSPCTAAGFSKSHSLGLAIDTPRALACRKRYRTRKHTRAVTGNKRSRDIASMLICFVAISLLSAGVLVPARASAQTPRLKIKAKNGLPGEEEAKQQLQRLAKQYDLKKYTITRDILIERGAMNHSHPVLTLNLRFLKNDDLALSAYVHEQGHWVLTERGPRVNRPLFDDLQRSVPGLSYRLPDGDGEMMSSYYHIAVCMLEWRAMEALVGAERARKVMEWKQSDHYRAIYATVLSRREQVESLLNRHGVSW
jgi:hypothetical protein